MYLTDRTADGSLYLYYILEGVDKQLIQFIQLIGLPNSVWNQITVPNPMVPLS